MANTLVTMDDYVRVLVNHQILFHSLSSIHPNVLTIKYYSPKWWNFGLKRRLIKCKDYVEVNKPFSIKVEWIDYNKVRMPKSYRNGYYAEEYQRIADDISNNMGRITWTKHGPFVGDIDVSIKFMYPATATATVGSATAYLL